MEPQFYCDLCDKSYTSTYSLSNHKRLYHIAEKDMNRTKNNNDNLYHCRYCKDKSYTTYKSRWRHEKNVNHRIIESNKFLKRTIKYKKKMIKLKKKQKK